MSRSVLVIDPHARDFTPKLAAAFPSVEVNAARNVEEARAFAPRAEVIYGMPRGFDEPLVDSARALKWIQAGTAGTDFLRRIKTFRPGTLVTSTRGMHGPQMAEMALAHMLALARQFPKALANMREHKWLRPEPQRRVFGKTVVIVGLGQSGGYLGPVCKALGMRVVGVSETVREIAGYDLVVPRAKLVEAVRDAHFLVLVLPYDQSTHHIINAKVLDAMRPDACLVNIARGNVVDEVALIEALRAKKIAGAGLDVVSKEPLPPESPLWDLDNVIITAHAGGECEEYGELAMEIFERNLRCYLAGRIDDMQNLVAF
jgi:phosphoglycerate dehydrogenase-like enzyme